MKPEKQLKTRELQETDVALIADYWCKAEPGFLRAMGVDLQKLPPRKEFIEMILHQMSLPLPEKKSFALIAELDGKPIGHCNLNPITYGAEAKMHLHLWSGGQRGQGIGSLMVQQALPVFFEKFKLHTIWSEPMAANIAPQRALEKAGFEFEGALVCTPGAINFEQTVHRYRLSHDEVRV